MPTALPYFLGCPVWACDRWVGKLYTNKNRRTWMRDYSRVFNTVEGNSTFYGIPSAATVQRWADQSEDGFRFVLKFPRSITHDCQLNECKADTREFLDLLEILAAADRLGPTFLQLPPTFHRHQLEDLEGYLRQLPREFPFAVEVRHSDYFDNSDTEFRLIDLLLELGMDWVLFDSRALFAKPPSDESELASQHRKPRIPLRTTVTGNHPIVRFVGRNKISDAAGEIREWATTMATWLEQGLQPFLFTHSPNDEFAPDLATMFHQELRQLIPELPELPNTQLARAKQGRLF